MSITSTNNLHGKSEATVDLELDVKEQLDPAFVGLVMEIERCHNVWNLCTVLKDLCHILRIQMAQPGDFSHFAGYLSREAVP